MRSLRCFTKKSTVVLNWARPQSQWPPKAPTPHLNPPLEKKEPFTHSMIPTTHWMDRLRAATAPIGNAGRLFGRPVFFYLSSGVWWGNRISRLANRRVTSGSRRSFASPPSVGGAGKLSVAAGEFDRRISSGGRALSSPVVSVNAVQNGKVDAAARTNPRPRHFGARLRGFAPAIRTRLRRVFSPRRSDARQ